MDQATPTDAVLDPRVNPWIWFTRILQFIFGLIVLGITGHAASWWDSNGCSTPSRLAFAISIVSFRSSYVLNLNSD